VSEKIYTVPTGKVSRFFYNWREWGFRLAWSMLTDPKSWEPVICDEIKLYDKGENK